MRSLWQGTVSFGLVALPVDIYAATEDHGPGLHLVHAVDGGRIRHRRVCELDGREVGPEETARGWEAPDGRTVVIQDADLEALPLPTKRVIDVLGFVDEAQVDPLLYARRYWVGAHGPGAEKPYALLVQALARSGRLAVCKVALRSRERLSVLRPRNGSGGPGRTPGSGRSGPCDRTHRRGALLLRLPGRVLPVRAPIARDRDARSVPPACAGGSGPCPIGQALEGHQDVAGLPTADG
ncbi:Ku protein [Streptomyces lydicamycinicus]|uniref:non-homologous end joining protein Ku n=1 Tax=Streptomyces lydicamycinicus TaxID=1546107 RepID=UPI003D8019D6